MAILSYLEMATQADRDVLQRCGLYKALRTPQYTSDQRLIVDIVSHWDRRRHVFHLPQVGDVMVTPRDIRRILGVPATGMPVRLGTLPSTEAAHREAAQFFTGAGRWDRRGAPLQTVLLSGIPRVRKMIILCILFRISRKQNYREVPGGWMDAVRRCEAGERMDWAALIAANLVAQLDTIRASGRGGLSYSTLLQCWFFDHFAAVAPAGGPHPITEGAPMVHRWQTRLRGTEDRAHVRRSVEATSLDLLTLPDYTAEPYRTVRWGSDDEAGGAGAPAGDDSSDGGDDGDSGGSGADPSRPAEAAGPSGTAGQAEGPSGAAEGEAGPSGAQGDVRGPVTRARRLRIVMGSAGARAGAIPTGRGTQAAEEVPEDEAPAAGGEPGGEDAVQPEDQAATAGTAEIRRLVEAVVREMFPQVYAEGQPPIQAGDEPRTAGAHREAFAPLVRARDMWAAESQEHATSLGQLQQERDGARRERDDARRERDDARRERDELRGRAQAQEAQGGAGGDSESRTQLIIITERLRVTEEALRGERDRIQARYDQLVAQMVSRSSRSGTHTHTAATTPRRPRDEGSEAGSSRRTRRSLGGVWSPGEGSQRPGEGAPGAGPQQ